MIKEQESIPIPGIGFGRWLQKNFGLEGLWDKYYLSLSNEDKAKLIIRFEAEAQDQAQSGSKGANYG